LLPGDADLEADLERIGGRLVVQLRNQRDSSSQTEQALMIAEIVASHRSSSPSDLAAFAHLLTRDGQFERALHYIDRALLLESDNFDHLRLRASLLERLRRLTEARQTARRVLHLKPEDRNLRLDLRRIQRKAVADTVKRMIFRR
jgi:Flp pilus assembly protein TadD